MTQIEAHEFAGYQPHRGNASSLAQEQSILERVAEIRAEAEERQRKATEKAVAKLAVTVESLLREAEAARVLAMTAKQPSAAIAAIKEKGVLAGLRVEKAERKNPYAALSDEELDRQLAEAMKVAGITPDTFCTALDC
jgi:hypothetical protein